MYIYCIVYRETELFFHDMYLNINQIFMIGCVQLLFFSYSRDFSDEHCKILAIQAGRNVTTIRIVRLQYRRGTAVSIADYRNVWHLACPDQVRIKAIQYYRMFYCICVLKIYSFNFAEFQLLNLVVARVKCER